MIGFGIGDVALFLAYYRIGARLTILLNLCLAPVFGALGEYLWMGTGVSGFEFACIAIVVTGIILALKPDKNHPPQIHGSVAAGVCFAIVAGMGQGFGAVISRYADGVAALKDLHLHGIGGGLSQAFVRTLGGLLVAVLCYGGYQWACARLRSSMTAAPGSTHPAKLSPSSDAARQRARKRFYPFWLVGAALTGPVIGVSCFQWALQTQKSAIVLAITATSPLLVTLMARAFEKEKTSLLATVGSLISVAGVIAICLAKLPPGFWR